MCKKFAKPNGRACCGGCKQSTRLAGRVAECFCDATQAGFKVEIWSDGDLLRYAGYRALKFGPLSDALIDRFSVKLGKALYYRHNGAVFEGYVYVRAFDFHIMQQKIRIYWMIF